MPPYSLGQQSKEDRKKTFENLPKKGMVFRSFSKIAHKEKFFVVVGVSKDSVLVGHLLINTKINHNCNFTPEIENLHMPIYARDYDFLHHDSYIDCRQLHDIDYIRIEEMYVKNKGKYKGDLTKENIEALKYIVKEASTISPKQKKKYGYK